MCYYTTCLTALVPRPVVNPTHYHGVFASNCHWRGSMLPSGSGWDTGVRFGQIHRVNSDQPARLLAREGGGLE